MWIILIMGMGGGLVWRFWGGDGRDGQEFIVTNELLSCHFECSFFFKSFPVDGKDALLKALVSNAIHTYDE